MPSSPTSSPEKLKETARPAAAEDHFESRLFVGLLALLLLAPLAFGAVEPWARLLQELGAALLTACWFFRWAQKPGLKLLWNPLYLPLATLAFVIVIQIAFHTTVYLHATLESSLQFAVCVMVFFLGNQLFARESRARRFGGVLAVFGGVLAFEAILQGLASPNKLYGLRTPRNGGLVYGPYVNHAHYAGLMEILVPFALALALPEKRSWARRLPWAIAAFLMAASIFLSESRGGMLAFLVQFLIVTATLLLTERRMRTRTGLAVAIGLFVVFSLWVGAGELEERLATFRHPGVSTHVRMQIVRDTLHMWRARPWLGWGLGTYVTAFPQFRSFHLNEVVNAAHNDYVQFLAELGLAGFLPILGFLAALYGIGLSTATAWRDNPAVAMRFAALVGVTGIAVHSLTDFNLQVPANAALFFALCALASGKSGSNA